MCPARHERKTPVTHNDFDLSKVLEQLKSDESGDLVRQMVTFLYQALIDAEATDVVQAERHERTLSRTTNEMARARGCSRPRPATSSSRYPNCERVRSSLPCSSGAGALTRPSTPSSWRLTCTGSRRARSTTSSRHSIRRRDLQVRGVEDLWAARRGDGGLSPTTLVAPGLCLLAL